MADMDVADVAAEVQKHLDSWNKPADDSGVTHLVGAQSHRDNGLTPLSSSVDAGRPDLYPEAFNQRVDGASDGEDDGDEGSYSDLTKAELKDLIDERNAERDEDEHLSKSGTKDELVARLEEDDDSE